MVPRNRILSIVARAFFFLIWPCLLLSGCESGCLSIDANLRHGNALRALTKRPHLRPFDEGGTTSSTEPELQFVGNVTAVVPPTTSGGTVSGVGLLRQADCSLTEYFINSFSTMTGAFTSSTVPDYQNFLHQAAQLTTTANQFKNGCTDTMIGKASASAVYLGKTSTGALIGAGIDYNNNLYVGTADFTAQVANYQTVTSVVGVDYMVAADLNGDGNQDLIVAAFGTSGGTDSGIYVFLGNGDGTFKAPVQYATGSDPSYFVVDDFNGDGKLDIATVATGGFLVLPGNGDGTFGTALSNSATVNGGLASGDVNGDGKKDLVSGGGQVFLGNGDGTFTAANSTFTVAGLGIPVLGDFNNDGKLDVAVNALGGNGVSVALGNGDGTFTSAGVYASLYGSFNISASDLDGDGNLDLVVGIGNSGGFGPDLNSGGLFMVLMGNGDGTFAGASVYGSSYNSSSILFGNSFNLGDFNGDGHLDMLEAAYESLIFAKGDGKGRFIQSPPVSGAVPLVVSSGLMNADKNLDAVYVDNSSGTPQLAVAIGNGDGTFAPPTFYNIPGTTVYYSDPAASLAVADFNGDGSPDVVLGNSTGIYLYLNDGTGALQSPTQIDSVGGVPSLVAADLNGDGKPDLVVADPGNMSVTPAVAGALKIYLGKGDGTLNTPSALTPNPVITGVAVGDLNGDGKLDLVVNSYDDSFANPLLTVYLGNGDGTFGAAISKAQTDTTGTGLAIADINGDGKPDVVQGGCCGAAYTTVFLGNGDGTFSDAPQLATGVSTHQVAAVDINGDGHPDIIASSIEGGSGGINVYLSLYGASTTSAPTSTTTNLTATPNPVTAGQTVTLTATVTASNGTPTGKVTFLDGTTTLGTGTLDSTGKATLSTSSLAAGTHSITAGYGGDSTFAASTSSAITVSVTAPAPSFALSLIPSSGTLASAGGSLTTTISVTPSNGFNSATSLACSGLPAHTTCSFSPSTVTPGTTAATSTLTITTAVANAQLDPLQLPGRSGPGSFGSPRSGPARVTLASVVGLCAAILLFGRRRRWSLNRALPALLLAGALWLTACNGSNSSSSTHTPIGTDSVTITATAGVVSQSTTFSLTVQ